jgi:glutathione S-transferase
MHDLILHHYAGSPFSEKMRLVLGFKGLAWKSVTVPVVLPKPDVIALTGGYRRTPFLQIGADIYCDTALMCRVIDRLAPTPPLYPHACGGAQHMMAHWADTVLFWAAIPYALQPAGQPYIFAGTPPDMVKRFLADRAAMAGSMRRPTLVDAGAQLKTALGWLAQQLSDGRRFLLGDAPCIADFAAAHSIWHIRRAPPVATVLKPYERVEPWFERVQAFGHGQHEEMGSEEAITIAREATSLGDLQFEAPEGFTFGEAVTVTPTDYAHDPVAGRLVGLTNDQVSVEREDERVGLVVVHFPRIGFQIRRAER